MTLIRESWSAGLGCFVHPTARIGPETYLGAHVWVGPGVRVGARCIVKPGTVIGGVGFGYERDEAGGWAPKDHPFSVVIEDDVHVGANTCIDRGSWRDTQVERGARIDNLVHVAHNVRIGRDVIVVAQAEISGSVHVHDEAWVGPSACIKERLTVGQRALVGMGAVVLKDVAANTTVAGNPARVINAEEGVRAVM